MQSTSQLFYQTNGNHINQNEVSNNNNAAALLLTNMTANNPNYAFTYGMTHYYVYHIQVF